MIFPVYVEGTELVAVLDRLLDALGNSQQLLFNEMSRLTETDDRPFTAPASHAEFSSKRNQIASIMQAPSILYGFERAMRLFEATYVAVDRQGGVPGLKSADFLAKVTLKTDRPEETIFLSRDLSWGVEWPVRSPRGNGKAAIGCVWHASAWGTVVPPYVVNYLSTAANAHMLQRNDVAMALLSIAAEATLRDVLASRGYSFTHGASSIDVFEYCDAHVSADVAGNRYLVAFSDTMPRTVADFSTSFPAAPVPIQVRRVIKDRTGTRIDLQIKTPQPLHEHWSTSGVATPAVRTVGGLGAALDIARNQEACVSPEDLPQDFDKVLQAVRNNLVHLSGAALNTPLSQFDRLKASGHFTLGDFVENEKLVHDFIVTIPRFVTAQYVKLRQQGTLVP
ncbi:hypothetical protein OKW50_004929 [Paraburkholderia youngii]|uniref:hypothetical protein n=1 Tax=Paraburkholderia youngii TaxID=2782701 RepID=UPI003D224F2F